MPTRQEYFLRQSTKIFFVGKDNGIEVEVQQPYTLTHALALKIAREKRGKKGFLLKGFVLHFVCLSRVY